MIMIEGDGGGGYGGGAGANPASGSVIVRSVGRPPTRKTTHSGRIGLAIAAERPMLSRGRSRRRPDCMIEITRRSRLLSKRARGVINSASTGAQLAFTGDAARAAYWPSEAVKLVVR